MKRALSRRDFLAAAGALVLTGCEDSPFVSAGTQGGDGVSASSSTAGAPVPLAQAPTSQASPGAAPAAAPAPAPAQQPYVASCPANATTPPLSSLPLPNWVPEPGRLVTVSTTNGWSSIDPCPANNCGYRRVGGNEWNKVIDDFSGGVLNPHWGSYGALLFHGGGHAATNDNSVALLDFNDLTFKLVGDPSRGVTDIDVASYSAGYPGLDRNYGEYFVDAKPAAAHTYDLLEVVPPSVYGDDFGTMVRPASGAVHTAWSGNVHWAHRFRMKSRTVDSIQSRAVNAWSRASVNGWASGGGATNQVPGADQSISFGNAGGCCAYDSLRNGIWWFMWPSNNRGRIIFLNCQNGQQQRVNYGGGEALFNIDTPILRYIPQHDLLVAIGSRNSSHSIFYFRPCQPQAGWTRITTTAPIQVTSDAATPWDWVPELNKIILFNPSDNQAIYEIELPGNLNSAWATTRRPFQSGAQLGSAWVVGKRFAWSSALRSIVFRPSAAGPADNQFFVYRPLGT